MQIFFDLDGTLIDISQKYYHVYARCTTEMGGTPITAASYIRLKRANTPIEQLMARSLLKRTDTQTFATLFMSYIETSDALSYDQLFPFTTQILTYLKKQGHSLFLVSARNDSAKAMQEITTFELLPFMTGIDVTRRNTNVRISKKNAIEKLRLPSTAHIGVGDTEDDINSMADTGGSTVAVLSGLRNKSSILSSCTPNYCIRSIRFLPTLLDFIIKHR